MILRACARCWFVGVVESGLRGVLGWLEGASGWLWGCGGRV